MESFLPYINWRIGLSIKYATKTKAMSSRSKAAFAVAVEKLCICLYYDRQYHFRNRALIFQYSGRFHLNQISRLRRRLGQNPMMNCEERKL